MAQQWAYLLPNGVTSRYVTMSGAIYVPDSNNILCVPIPQNGRDIQDLVVSGCEVNSAWISRLPAYIAQPGPQS